VSRESDIVFHGTVVSVVQTGRTYEVRVELDHHAVCVGSHPDLSRAIQVAKRLDAYPKNAIAFAQGR
jgi:hypothetical protein